MTDTRHLASTVLLHPGEGGPQVSGRYELLGELGRGGMGVVYRARHRKLDKLVAVKVIKPGLDADRFLREARILARVNSPHVVGIQDCDVLVDGSPMLVMELVDGRDLRQVMEAANGPLEESETLRWMRQTALGLLAAADLGIIHRDVKPSNILIGTDDRLRVLDFGLARSVGEDLSLTVTGSQMGTPYYMAPEQAEDPRSVDTRADIYSFGATYYHALTGVPPYSGETPFAVLFKHKTKPLVSPRARNPALSTITAEVLERCLAKSPGERFDSFKNLLRFLQPVPDGGSPWSAPDDEGLREHFERFKSRHAAYVTRDLPPQASDDYHFPGGKVLKILIGDITEQRVDALVSSDNAYLTMDGGCASAIARLAGDLVLQWARAMVPVLPGRVVVTPAGKLPARFIFHAVTNGYIGRKYHASRDILNELVAAILYHADTLSVQSLAMPLLGAGGAGIPEEVALTAVFQAIARHLQRGMTTVNEVRLVLFGERLDV
jgi:eukaryotic-like serine/threonine-protein kinase